MTYTAQGNLNPTLELATPAWWWFAIAAVMLTIALVVAALISIARSQQLGRLETVALAVWVLIVLAFPFAGSLLWFLVGRRASSTGDDALPSAGRLAAHDDS